MWNTGFFLIRVQEIYQQFFVQYCSLSQDIVWKKEVLHTVIAIMKIITE